MCTLILHRKIDAFLLRWGKAWHLFPVNQQINTETIKHRGLVFGGINLATGAVAWKKLVSYTGMSTLTPMASLVQLVRRKNFLFARLPSLPNDIPAGIITSTFIQYMDKDLVIIGAIWDGEDDLNLNQLPSRLKK